MNDTRSIEIKKILKKTYPSAQFKVRIQKYSMGESIYVCTDLFKRDRKELEYGGWTMGYSDEAVAKIREVKSLLKNYESVDRDQYGDILSGGNTFLFVEEF